MYESYCIMYIKIRFTVHLNFKKGNHILKLLNQFTLVARVARLMEVTLGTHTEQYALSLHRSVLARSVLPSNLAVRARNRDILV